MKNYLTLLLIFLVAIICFQKVQATTYEEIVSSPKPGAVLIYADWADNVQPALAAFGTVEQSFSGRYSFAKINICTKDAKAFNQRNYIYPNLPYVLLFKERGRMSRSVSSDCLLNESCIREKLDIFAN